MAGNLATGIAMLVLAGVHAGAGRLRFLDRLPRSRWLSAAGGASVAYVFVHLLPELAASQQTLQSAAGGWLQRLEHHVWLLALLGLILFYGLERLVRGHRARRSPDADSHPGVFWLHIAAFAVYNGLIGYLLVHRPLADHGELGWYTAAMALHFLVTDRAMSHDQQDAYRRIGRWILVSAIALGWALGLATAVSDAALAALMALLGGGVILNVLKEELPAERESRFSAFLLGAISFAALLLMV